MDPEEETKGQMSHSSPVPMSLPQVLAHQPFLPASAPAGSSPNPEPALCCDLGEVALERRLKGVGTKTCIFCLQQHGVLSDGFKRIIRADGSSVPVACDEWPRANHRQVVLQAVVPLPKWTVIRDDFAVRL